MIPKLVTIAISPLGTSILLAFVAQIGFVKGCGRWPSWLNALAWSWLVFWSIPLISSSFRASLESEFPLQSIDHIKAAPVIVVLGGAMRSGDGLHPNPGLTDTSDRVWEAARLYLAGKAPLLLLSGGADSIYNLTSEAGAMRILLRDLGVPDSAMVEEPNSRTTQQNARYSGLLLRERNIKELLLVTSAWHMRRAKKLFEREGFQVYPVPTDYHEYPKSGWLAFLPNADALEDSGRSIKEWVGSQVQ